jgi:two-component system cell cycle sensor histidine kinase/response regulator CckA
VTTPLRVLLVEDVEADAELVLLRLADEGFRAAAQRVETAADYRAALDERPDCILADWRLPHFSGLEALRILRDRDLDLPFIIVSGHIGEEAVVEALRHGAYDYVPKDRLARLGTAIRHAAEERRLREERRTAEAALRSSEELFRSVALNTPDHIIVQDRDLRYTMVVNPQLGLTEAQMLGRTDLEIVPGDDGARLTRLKHQVLESGQTLRVEVPLTSLAGTLEHFEGSYIPRFDAAGRVDGVIGYFRNVTARKQAEAEMDALQVQLQQARKLEAVGRLAGGVAHDFNNALQAILLNTEMALVEAPEESALAENLVEIRSAGRRSAALTAQLLAFARKQTVSPAQLSLNDAVTGMLTMLRRLIGEDVALHWTPGADLWSVWMDPSQFDQILANLAVNARDAIDGVGNLTLETANVTLDEDYCAAHVYMVPGEYVLLTVSDDGCGMDRHTLAHAFEPFFTTKELGAGTGLGLATVYGIVKQNDGFINVYSEPAHGTTFRIYLPRRHSATPGEVTPPGQGAPPRGGSETLLLVEDDPTVLRAAEAILVRLGYAVLAADGPDEALRVAQAHAGPIDLVVTDVVMPEMNGRQLVERLATLREGFRTLYVSGYPADDIAQRGVLEAGVRYLSKPFDGDAFARAVRAALDAA